MSTEAPAIAFVEDSDLDFEMAVRAVRAIAPEARVLRGQTFHDAVKILAEPRLRLLVLDINLPTCNGLDILQQIQKLDEARRIKVVVFSTSSNPADRTAALSSGAVGYHEKPSDTQAYFDTVAAFVEPWLDGPATDPTRPPEPTP
ncbi:Response regulator rcp1 [Posidoniimonas polymericola]|uniref:Response regulator rcp1 n=1 Tax=Posidoniimonas polymericola TaxID=2528002 RepID=A0A5C5YTP6_9BACT|nr:response regulator [Posidoniimonas polymericola]TWT78037.1 Response regulator rcp1 [Posidoniimonas polymericola]